MFGRFMKSWDQTLSNFSTKDNELGHTDAGIPDLRTTDLSYNL